MAPKLSLTASSLILALTLAASSVRAETLVDVVQEALHSNPELGAIRFNRRAIDQELTAARGLRLPTVDVQASSGPRHSIDTAASGISTGTGWHTNEGASAIVSQRLFDGRESRSEIERQRSRVASARWRVSDTANSIALRAIQAYLELLRAKAVLEASARNLTAHEHLLSRVRARVNGGRAAASDETEALTRTFSARALHVEAQNRLNDGNALFRSVVGRAPHHLVAPSPPVSALPASIDAAVGEAVSAAPSVMATAQDVHAAEAAVDGARARYSPKVNLEGTTAYDWNGVEQGDRSRDARLMVVVRWNLFNGGIDRARIDEAKARALEAVEVSANTRLIVERETRNSWNALSAARQRVPQLQKQLDYARQTRSAYAAQFESGQRRLLDLLNIQSEVFLAESSLQTEQLVRTYNVYRILAAGGRLVPAIGLELPPEALLPAEPGSHDGWVGKIEYKK